MESWNVEVSFVVLKIVISFNFNCVNNVIVDVEIIEIIGLGEIEI